MLTPAEIENKVRFTHLQFARIHLQTVAISEPMPRTDFTDAQRAEIFCLDHATCSFSGRSLWILDFGLDPTFAIDWADHIKPASRHGRSDVGNGAAAGWFHNHLRGDSHGRLYLFHRGRPTYESVFFHHGPLPKSTIDNLRRFQRLHPSDWYLNRGLWHLWLACTVEVEVNNGAQRTRRKDYYARASFKMLTQWRRLVARDAVPSIEKRNLVPKRLPSDAKLLLSARELFDEADLEDLIDELLKIFIPTESLVHALASVERRSNIYRVRTMARQKRIIPARIRARVLSTLGQLESILPIQRLGS